MSSMFKKKGGPAFKPKIPSARARPAAPAAPSQPAKPPQSQPSIESQSKPVPEEPEKKAPAGTPAAASSESQSQESSIPPRQKSSTPTPPVQVSDPAPSDPIVPAEKPSTDKPREPDVAVVATVKETSGKEITTGGLGATLEPAQAEPKSTEAKTTEDVIVTDASSSDSQADTTPLTETPTPTAEARPDVGATESPVKSSITPGESNEDPPEQAVEPQAKPTSKPRTRRQTAKASVAAETGEDDESARPKKRQRKTATQEGAEGRETTPKQSRKRKTAIEANGESQPRRRRARSVTPEDSENQVVDLQQLKMADLTRDLHIGKKFSRHDELRERERRARLKSKLGDGERDSSATPEPSAKTGSPLAPTPPAESATAPASGPQFRIVDGQIVIDQSSLSVDRHARAAARLGDMETVEENDFTRLITSNSFMNTSKLKGPNIWTDEETELFYRGLRMFGTDFEIIAKMFPSKQRRHVKLKFNREERHCPRRVDAALIGEKTIKIDLDEYKAHTGAEFESVESIEAEQRKMQEDFEAEQKRIADEQAEIMRKKREELFADDDEDIAKKKKGGKKGKQKIIYGLNGEPIPAES